MSAYSFPSTFCTVLCPPDGIERTPSYGEIVCTTISGKEQRTQLQTSVIYTYRLKFPMLRESVAWTGTALGDLAESSVIEAWFAQHSTHDSFPFTDPVSGSSVTVRFVSAPDRKRVFPGVYAYDSIELLTVL